jgi:hypothetical protein
MKSYAAQVLEQSSIVEFDSMCDVLLDESKDISPLLRHYDQLQTMFRMPSVGMLRLDQ